LSAAEPSAANLSLVTAAARDDWSRADTLLANQDAVRASQADGMTALHWAIHYNRADQVGKLLAAGASATAATAFKITPLQVACDHGNATIIRALLAAGANARDSVEGGESMLMLAARSGRSDAVQALLEHGAKIDGDNQKGQTALMWAAAEGHVEVVKLLLAAKADPKRRTEKGFSALLFAVRAGHRAVVDALLAAKVDPNEAIDGKKDSKSDKGGTGALLVALENGHFEVAIRLVEAGADPNDQRSGYTALHTMTWVRKPERGDDNGQPPPAPSGTMTSLVCVRELVRLGAKVDQPLGKGVPKHGKMSLVGATPLFMAAQSADLELMKVLVELGADFKRPNEDGATPLMTAAGLGSAAPDEEAGTEPECAAAVSYLISLGAEVNTVDKNKETAMHGAAYKNLPAVVHLLAKHGADISLWNRKNDFGWTPLLIAEGFRPGNFKPSESTIVAIRAVMSAAGVTPPPPTPRPDAAKPLAKDKSYPPEP
jgi:ankyrin repeat protein